jgi:thioesterase domain-containing protein/acyl carrier protein
LQAHLAAIWEDVLGIRPIGIQDNFFELGGHSLLAVRLFAQIEDKLGVKLPLTVLFQEATIESLARRIDEQSGNQAWSSLLEIQPEGSKPPFFCIHGLTGDILWFRDLAACFVSERPFYGLQARGLDAIQEPFSQVELMATFYITEMKRVQPAGPYYLGGASFGGTVALEVAHQLLAQGEQVGLLAIFDHAPFNIRGSNNEQITSTKKLYNVIKIAKNLPRWLKFFLRLKPSEQVGRVQRKVRVMRKNFKGKFSQSGVDIDSIDAVDIIDYADQLPLHRRKLIEAHALALKNYLPKPYSGQVTLFRAQARPLLKTYDPEIGWRKLVSGQQLNIVDVPGSHEGMFKPPYVQTLAQELRTYLDKDQVQSGQIEKT